MDNDFELLARDLYQEGYQCGISGNNTDKWFKAWGIAMQKVANGEKYTEGMVNDCFNEI